MTTEASGVKLRARREDHKLFKDEGLQVCACFYILAIMPSPRLGKP